jgi:PilZ domain
MVWTITIATFLGTVIALLFIFLIFARREQIRKALRERRRESRTPAAVGLELSSVDEPLIYEHALTENASRHGARVVTKKRWRRGESVLFRLPPGGARARIAYCVALPGDSFAIGLRCSSAVHDWVITRSEISNDYGSGLLFRK